MDTQVIPNPNVQIPPYCPVETTLRVIGGKWKPLVIFQLHEGPKRFNELQRKVGSLSARVLILQLKELILDGVVHRKSYEEIPPKVEYSLTERGESLKPVLAAMAQWGMKHGMLNRH